MSCAKSCCPRNFALAKKLGVGEQVREKLKAIGWKLLLGWSNVTYTSLVKEFYSMLKVKTDLGGVPFFMEFNLFREVKRMDIAYLVIMMGMTEFNDMYYRGAQR